MLYEEHPELEDTIVLAGRKRRIVYLSGEKKRSDRKPINISPDGSIEVDPEYPLFRSKRYGEVFKRVCILAALGGRRMLFGKTNV